MSDYYYNDYKNRNIVYERQIEDMLENTSKQFEMGLKNYNINLPTSLKQAASLIEELDFQKGYLFEESNDPRLKYDFELKRAMDFMAVYVELIEEFGPMYSHEIPLVNL
ncbi:MAG: hypothetical protein ABIA04_13880 [Pseudomonadota bacterium]